MTRTIEAIHPEPGIATHVLITNENRRRLQPLVLFDAGPVSSRTRWGLPWHPHSGVGILTLPYQGDLHHQDTGGNAGVIREGGFQWMQTGGGLWHKEEYEPNDGRIGIHQLWVQLPPGLETAPVEYGNVQPEDVPRHNNTRVLVGEYEGTTARVELPVPLTYLDVSLEAGEHWRFEAPAQQTQAFIFPRSGELQVAERTIGALRMGILAPTDQPVHVVATEASRFVAVFSEPSTLPLITSNGQIHTTTEALEQARRNIEACDPHSTQTKG